MAVTDFGALTGMQKKLWSAYVISAGRDQSFWMGGNGFLSKGTRDATKPVHYVTELTEDERGTKCVVPIVHDLKGDGVVGDNMLEGNEESLTDDFIEIQIDQLRNGVKSKGRLSEQRTVIQFRVQAKDKLAFWKGDREDELMFLTASGVAFTKKLDGTTRGVSQWPQLAFAGDVTAPTANRVFYAGTATSTATLTSSDKMSWRLLNSLKATAIRKRVKPLRIGGKPHYIVIMSPEQARDLRDDTDYKAACGQAAKRGDKNPLFTGDFMTVNGLVLYEHNKINNTLGLSSGSKWGAAGTVDGAQALLVGAQALGYAHIGQDSWEESDMTDYKNRKGMSYGCMVGMIKIVFDSIYDPDANGDNTSQDFSILSLYTSAAES